MKKVITNPLSYIVNFDTISDKISILTNYPISISHSFKDIDLNLLWNIDTFMQLRKTSWYESKYEHSYQFDKIISVGIYSSFELTTKLETYDSIGDSF